MSEPIVVVVPLKAAEGRADELVEAFSRCIEATVEEEGCLKYALHRDVSDPNSFVHIEVWRSKDDLDQHSAQPYLTELVQAMGAPGLLAGGAGMTFATAVGIGGAKGTLA